MITLQRCAACGSPNVKLDYRKEGFNVGKGVAGAVLVGPVGALWGTDGNKISTYQCPDCGIVLNYCMDSGKALKISEAIYEYEKSGKIDFMLPEYKRKYKNIEWDNHDIETEPKITYFKIEEEILGYINKTGTAVLELIIKLDFPKLLNCEREDVEFCLENLKRQGRIKCEEINHDKYVYIDADIDEMRNHIYKKGAKRRAINYVLERGVEFDQPLAEKLGVNKTYSIENIEVAIKELFTKQIDEENPYVADEFVRYLISDLKSRFVLIEKDNLFTILGFEEAELLRKEKARKEEEERLEEKKVKEKPFIDFFNNHQDETFMVEEIMKEANNFEVFNAKDIAIDSMDPSAILNDLVKDGKLEKIIKNNKIYYGVPGIEDRKKYKLACEYLEKCNTQIEYIEAAEKFAELNDYEDSAEKSEYCLKLAVEAKIKEEEEAKIKEAQEAKRKAEEAKIKAEEAKMKAEEVAKIKKKIKLPLIILSIIVVIASVGVHKMMVIEKEKEAKEQALIAKEQALIAKEKAEELATIRMKLPQSISAGEGHVVGLKSDRTVVATGLNKYGQCNVEEWTDIVAVSAGFAHTVGLKSGGTVVATGLNEEGQCNVEGWKGIVAVSAGSSHTVGLKSDGTVVAIGDNSFGECNVEGWRDIVAVSVGDYHTVGLKSDGTVVATGDNGDGQCNVKVWRDIVAVSAGENHTVGLKSDGTVVGIEEWTDIVAVSADGRRIVGLKSDGTVVAIGDNEYGECDVDKWTDIVAVSAETYHTVGLKSDGTVVATGYNGDGRCDVENWENIATTNLK